jgi:preprotein translocase subunit SecA
MNPAVELEAVMTPEERQAQLERKLEQEQKEREERVQRLNLFSGPAESEAARPQTVKREAEKVGRNDPCPCGSGKKFKKCHGLTSAAG